MRESRRLLVVILCSLLVAAALGVSSTGAGATTDPEPPSAPGQLLVGYELGASAKSRADARAQNGARLIDRVVTATAGRAEVELVALPAGADRNAAIQRFEANPNVAYAEPNWVLTHDATSNDPYYTGGSLWGMYGDATSPANKYGSQAGEAWAAGNTGGSNVVVGVIDEGIDFNHPDLAANIWTNPYDPVDGIDNDGNGYVDDVHGWDFYYGDNTVYDGGKQDKHGTHVAGTIAGAGGNGQGVAGVAWKTTLVSLKFLGPNGGYTSGAVKAVDYLTDLKSRHKLNVVASNNSWGGGGYSSALSAAIDRANVAGVLFVAAAGNGGSDGVGDDNDSAPHYPSSYPHANVVAVASITSSGSKSGFSNYGKTTVDLGAPGSGIYSTLPGNTYGSYSGTSMATPHVTGGAALAAAGGLSGVANIRDAIFGATVLTPSLDGKTVTGGRLNVSGFTGSSGTITSPTTGTLSGVVSDASTGAVIAGATVTAGATSTTTDSIGSYSLALAGATYDVTYSASGHLSKTITVVVTNGETTTTNAALEPSNSGISLTAEGHKVKGVQHAKLTWTGTSAVDVYRSDKSGAIATNVIDQPHDDNINKRGGGSYTYKVCAAVTTTCSNEATVTF